MRDARSTPFGPVPSEVESSVANTILSHVSVRKFRPDPVPDETLALLCEAMRRAPSSSALQTRTFVILTDLDVRRTVRSHAGGQAFIDDCPAFIVGCADLRRISDAVSNRAYPDRSGDMRLLLTATEDVSIALQNASLLAQSLGLGTVMVGGVLNGALEISKLLGLPWRVLPLLGLCVGYSAEPAQEVRPRLPPPVIFHKNHYELSPEEEAVHLAEHDRAVIARGYYLGRRISWDDIGGSDEDPVTDEEYGWLEHVARKQARLWWDAATPKLIKDLHTLGWGEKEHTQ
jgi:nitroreductase